MNNCGPTFALPCICIYVIVHITNIIHICISIFPSLLSPSFPLFLALVSLLPTWKSHSRGSPDITLLSSEAVRLNVKKPIPALPYSLTSMARSWGPAGVQGADCPVPHHGGRLCPQTPSSVYKSEMKKGSTVSRKGPEPVSLEPRM